MTGSPGVRSLIPLVFLVSDLTNRAVGCSLPPARWPGPDSRWPWCSRGGWPTRASRWASGTAFIVSQLLDISVFNRWRAQSWWKAPFFGSMIGSVIDTALFFSIAFAGTDVPWMSLAVGDLAAKWAMALLLLAPLPRHARPPRLVGAAGRGHVLSQT